MPEAAAQMYDELTQYVAYKRKVIEVTGEEAGLPCLRLHGQAERQVSSITFITSVTEA
jgi:hypothetical protein